jgi:hypothetical protein
MHHGSCIHQEQQVGDSIITDVTEKNKMSLNLVQTTHKLRTRLRVDRGQ